METNNWTEKYLSFPGGSVVKNQLISAGDMGSIPGLESSTYNGATKPVHHNYWACALDPRSYNYWAQVPQWLKSTTLEPMLHNKRSHHNEKPTRPKSGSRPLQLDKAGGAMKTQHSQNK